jgi:hypothetical protein
MDKKTVARRLLVVAKNLLAEAGDTMFTVMKPIRFKQEHGTRVSLENAQLIKDAGYEFVKGVYSFDKKGPLGWELQAFFKRGSEVAVHTFKGFSFGYGGEGPHGMVEFSDMFGIGLNKNKIFGDEDAGLGDKGTVDLVQAFG